VVFGHIAQISSEGIPYPIFSYAALVPYYFAATAVSLSSNNLVGGAQLITKVYFPRIFLVTSPVIAGLIDMALALVVLFGLMVYYGIAPSIGLVALPAFVAIAAVTALGVGAWLAALNVKYRDVRFLVPFFLQAWLFITPVIYSIDGLAQPWKTLYALNPLVAVVEGFRWALAGGAAPDGLTIATSSMSAAGLMLAGTYYFGRAERAFADFI
jgi:lipopolysaccharide transport system permease protein